MTEVGQHVFKQHADQHLVFDHKDAKSDGALAGPVNQSTPFWDLWLAIMLADPDESGNTQSYNYHPQNLPGNDRRKTIKTEKSSIRKV